MLYTTCQYIAVSKRHQNHYRLTRTLVERYAIPVAAAPSLPPDYRRSRGQPPPRCCS